MIATPWGIPSPKLVVIDDRLAFAGGIDLTCHRWDRPLNVPDDPRRVDAGGEPFDPFHDMQMAVSVETIPQNRGGSIRANMIDLTRSTQAWKGAPFPGVNAESHRRKDRSRGAVGATRSVLALDEAEGCGIRSSAYLESAVDRAFRDRFAALLPDRLLDVNYIHPGGDNYIAPSVTG